MESLQIVGVEAADGAIAFWSSQLFDAKVCDVGTLDKTNAFQFGKACKMNH